MRSSNQPISSSCPGRPARRAARRRRCRCRSCSRTAALVTYPTQRVAGVHRLLAQDDAVGRRASGSQPARDAARCRRARRPPGRRRRPSASLHGEAEAGLPRVVLEGHVGAEGAVALLQPQAVERRRGRRRSRRAPGRPPTACPRASARGRRWCTAPSPARRRTTAAAPSPARCRRGASLGRGSTPNASFDTSARRQRLQDVARPRAPQADAAGARRDVADRRPTRRPAARRASRSRSSVAVGADLVAVAGRAARR